MPSLVADELENPKRNYVPIAVRSNPIFRIQAPVDVGKVTSISPRLHLPEAQSLALALEQRAELVAIDESVGRAVAARLGLATIGALGILAQMRHRGLIGELKPLIVRLRDELRFRMSDTLIAEILTSVGESPDKI